MAFPPALLAKMTVTGIPVTGIPFPFVMARFMRAIQFCADEKLDGPDKPGHDDNAETKRAQVAPGSFSFQ